MKYVLSVGLAVALFATAGVLQAELKSGLQQGESIGAFIVEKVAGNPTDNVKQGQKLCYRCKLGNRPVVTVFARSADDNLAKLVKQLDQFVAQHEEQKAASFVNLLGEDTSELKTQANQLVEKSGAENVAVVTLADDAQGFGELKLNPEADVTVLIYSKGKIAANHAFAEGQLDDQAIAKIMADTGKIVK